MSMYRSFIPARAKKNNDFDDLLDCLFWLFMDEADVVEIEGDRYIEESQVYELISKFKADMNGGEISKETDADWKCFMCEEKEAAYKVGYDEGLKAGKSAFNEGGKDEGNNQT